LLARLEHEGLVSSEWQAGDGGPGRKDFAITVAGRASLAQGSVGWTDFAARIGSFLHQSHRTEAAG